MLRLYGTRETRAFRVLWMLEELGRCLYELMRIGPPRTATPRSPERFLKINPNGHVPALVDGDLRALRVDLQSISTCREVRAATLWP